MVLCALQFIVLLFCIRSSRPAPEDTGYSNEGWNNEQSWGADDWNGGGWGAGGGWNDPNAAEDEWDGRGSSTDSRPPWRQNRVWDPPFHIQHALQISLPYR